MAGTIRVVVQIPAATSQLWFARLQDKHVWMCHHFVVLLLQARLDQLQADRDQLDARATTAEHDLATATSQLEEARMSLKVKLEEQQNQFRAIEEEQYSEWEKRVSPCTAPCVHIMSVVDAVVACRHECGMTTSDAL